MYNDGDNGRLEINNQNKLLIRQVFDMESDGHKDARELYGDEILGFLIQTEDGSYTLSSDLRDNEKETLHSTFGARSEAFEKFVIPSKLLEKAEEGGVIRVLDICSGVGYNVSALLDYLKDCDVEIEVDMVESSIETLATTLFVPDVCDSHSYVKKAIESYLIDHDYLCFNKVLSNIPSNVKININVCDARDFVRFPSEKEYDAVFLDPFSPALCPELYSVDFFVKLKDFLTPTALVLTYTAASPVRGAFIDAGFYIGEGPRFNRSGGTIASKSPDLIDTPLDFGDMKLVALSDVGIPYIDPNLDDDYETIIERRHNQRVTVRGKTMFTSASKLPRYLGLSQDEVGDKALFSKLNSYVAEMGFDSISDERIVDLLSVDKSATSRDQILQLRSNLEKLLN